MLTRLFSPRAIAVIGASRNPGKLGYEVIHNIIAHGFAGEIFPVNPFAQEVLGKKSYADIKDVPRKVDVAVIVVPRDNVLEVVKSCGVAGVSYAVIITAGFRETGEEGAALEQEMLKIAQKYKMRIVGPNCLGFLHPSARLNASFTDGLPKKGNVALVSQSGAMCVSILDWAKDSGMGFSSVTTIGNSLDLGIVDILEHLEKDPETQVILMYVESITHGQELIRVAARITRNKPIVFLKTGMSEAGGRAAQSHTGALAGNREAIDALCIKTGMIAVHTSQEFFDVGLLLSSGRIPRGNEIVILTNAGGPGVLTVDAMEGTILTLSELSLKTKSILQKQLPQSASLHNPIDIIGDAPPERYAWALQNITHKETDALIVILTPQIMTDPVRAAGVVIDAYKRTTLPMMASFMGGGNVHLARALLNRAGVPHVSTPERAVRAYDIVMREQSRLRVVRTLPQASSRTQKKLPKVNGHPQLKTQEVEKVLSEVGLSVVHSQMIRSLKGCKSITDFPIVMKIASRDIIHKTQSGGVMLNIQSVEEAQKAFTQITTTIRKRFPKAECEGVLVQPMLPKQKGSIEMIVGVKKDPVCGMVLLCGIGGVTVEVLPDVAFALAPISHAEALEMIDSLHSRSLLKNSDISALAETLVSIAKSSVQYAGIMSLDINPVVVHRKGQGVTILDARILV